MGRGRQKAKQTKVARQLKYFSPNTDYDALRRELTSADGHEYPSGSVVDDDDADELEGDDEAEDDEDDDYADWSPGQRR